MFVYLTTAFEYLALFYKEDVLLDFKEKVSYITALGRRNESPQGEGNYCRTMRQGLLHP